MSNKTFSVVGKRLPMLEGPDKVSGRAIYTHDVRLRGMLYAKVLRSPHPHALIRSIYIEAAERLPGVRAVVTAADTPKKLYVHLGGSASDRYPLAIDKVRFVGEEVAAVAADDEAAAEEALGLIRVDYKVLDSVHDPFDAMKPGEPDVHGETALPDGVSEEEADTLAGVRNIASWQRRHFGDVDAGLAEADVIAEDEFYFASQTHCCMETNSCVANWDGDRVTVWTSTQSPYFIQKELSTVLDLPEEKVRIMEVAVGGGYGGKSKVCEHEALCALLSIKSGQPVKLVLSRDDEFRTTKTRHPAHVHIRQGATRDGRLTARDMRVVMENGAYNATGPSIMGYGGMIAASHYRIQSFRLDGRLVYTNRVPGGQFRGYGSPQVTFAMESQMDILAEKLGMDPVEFRVKNLNRSGDTTLCGWEITTCGFEECVREVAEAIGWEEKRRDPKPYHGVGVATLIHCSGTYVYTDGDYATVGVEIDDGGKVLLRTGSADSGTWQNTTLAQIAAEALGVNLRDVHVKSMDTDETPRDLGSWASRTCFVTGNAARLAALELRERILEQAAGMIEAPRNELAVEDGWVSVVGAPARRLSIAEVSRELGGFQVQKRYQTPTELIDRKTGVANISAAYTFGAQAVYLRVDPETGAVHILDFVASNDVGQTINPLAVEGQIEGGIVQGIGAALSEELIFEDGKMVNPSFLDYGVPRATDAPDIQVHVVETDDPEGPFGAKGVGEPGLVPTSPAVANAIYHATGVRIKSLPITRQKILEGLAGKEGRARPKKSPGIRPKHWWVGGMRAAYPAVKPMLERLKGVIAPNTQRVSRVDYERVDTLEEAVRLLARRPAESKVMAGGTDLMAGIDQGIYRPKVVVDVSEVPELRRQEVNGEFIRLGAGLRLSELEGVEELFVHYSFIIDAVRQVATPQIRNMATVGGNICQEKRCWFFRNDFQCYKRGGWSCPCYAVLGDNRNHAILGAHRCQAVAPSDMATVFAASDALVEVLGGGARLRRIPFRRFYKGPGEPAIGKKEIVTAVLLPVPQRKPVSLYEKICLRESDFVTVSAAVNVTLDDARRVTSARLVLGGVGYKPWQDSRADRAVVGARLEDEAVDRAVRILLRDSYPLRDNAYKEGLAGKLLKRLAERIHKGEV
ncbi:MAG: molybdopterin cofactor-binding domain-containing protein [Nitrospinota bacterium]